jgi:hypothetical protein
MVSGFASSSSERGDTVNRLLGRRGRAAPNFSPASTYNRPCGPGGRASPKTTSRRERSGVSEAKARAYSSSRRPNPPLRRCHNGPNQPLQRRGRLAGRSMDSGAGRARVIVARWHNLVLSSVSSSPITKPAMTHTGHLLWASTANESCPRRLTAPRPVDRWRGHGLSSRNVSIRLLERDPE